MRIAVGEKTLGGALALLLCGLVPLSVAQEQPADNMQLLRDKLLERAGGVCASGRDRNACEGDRVRGSHVLRRSLRCY